MSESGVRHLESAEQYRQDAALIQLLQANVFQLRFFPVIENIRPDQARNPETS